MEPTRTIAIPTIPQAISVLYRAVSLAQKAGVYSLDDAYHINQALEALRFRLHLDREMRPINLQPPSSSESNILEPPSLVDPFIPEIETETKIPDEFIIH